MVNVASRGPVHHLWNRSCLGTNTSLFFTAGGHGEQRGLFGTITPVENLVGGDQ
jgi:hypothetical protein